MDTWTWSRGHGVATAIATTSFPTCSLGEAQDIERELWARLPENCGEVLETRCSPQDGYYFVKPVDTDATLEVRVNERVQLPGYGVSVYCRFEGKSAWMLVGTVKSGGMSPSNPPPRPATNPHARFARAPANVSRLCLRFEMHNLDII